MRRHRGSASKLNSAVAHVESEPGATAVDNPHRSEPFERNVPGASKVLGVKAKRGSAPKNERKPSRK